MHGGLAGQIGPFIEQHGPELRHSEIDVGRAVQQGEYVVSFALGERVGWCSSRRPRAVDRSGESPVVRGPRAPGERARFGGADHLDEFVTRGDDHFVDFLSDSALSASDSKSAEAFPMMSSAIFARASSASVRS